VLAFDGSLNTGLTLRTVRLKDGVAEVRAGATLLYDSVPELEERETRLKASAFLDAVRGMELPPAMPPAVSSPDGPGRGKRVLLVDHQDSFVHTLANYLRQTGAEVVTLRAGFPRSAFDEMQPHLVVLSPGPGSPQDFDVSGTVAAVLERKLPVFGVCLGLQGIIEHFGGELAVLDYPVHGKPSSIRVLGGAVFEGLPATFRAGRYHSLYAIRERLPAVLRVTAESDDGVIMAVEHVSLPIAAVQFHPESLLTLDGDVGLELLRNVVRKLC
jgi:anthranilate synthase